MSGPLAKATEDLVTDTTALTPLAINGSGAVSTSFLHRPHTRPTTGHGCILYSALAHCTSCLPTSCLSRLTVDRHLFNILLDIALALCSSVSRCEEAAERQPQEPERVGRLLRAELHREYSGIGGHEEVCNA